MFLPYSKWFGTAFQRLRCSYELGPLLWHSQQASTWNERAEALARCHEVLARLQNESKVSRTLSTNVSPFYDRPFPVIHGELFSQTLVEQITDPAVQHIATLRLIGNINQWSDNTDMEGIEREKLRQLYR